MLFHRASHSYSSLHSLLLALCIVLTGCLSTGNRSDTPSKRATLADFAAEQQAVSVAQVELSESQRAAKLKAIYLQLLSLEPDPEVRTKLEYRLVQINSEAYEAQAFGTDIPDSNSAHSERLALVKIKNDEQALQQLIDDYHALLQRFPNRAENEHIRYQLAKALDLQGQLQPSLNQMELLLSRYPQTKYFVELNFRRGEIYYNLEDYSAAIQAYHQVLNARNNEKYRVNSLYMQGWSHFKLGRFYHADQSFLKVFDAMLTLENLEQSRDNFSFEQLSNRHQNLAIDTQRVLSISLSQQQQSLSLVELVNHSQTQYLPLYQHLLFKHLATFLLQKDLIFDAQQTYQAYIELAKDNIWAARFTLPLLDLLKQQGKFNEAQTLKGDYIQQFGLTSRFWQQAPLAQQQELLPKLLEFSEEHSRRLYAHAQSQSNGTVRIQAFTSAASALKAYLEIARYASVHSQALLSGNLLPEESLYADANFEAQDYPKALQLYKSIAYGDKPIALQTSSEAQAHQPSRSVAAQDKEIKQNAAYAATVTIRKMTPSNITANSVHTDDWRLERNQLDKLFIEHYPQDKRALELATHAAKYAFDDNDLTALTQFKNFVLQSHGLDTQHLSTNQASLQARQLSPVALQQAQVVSQLFAHKQYQDKQFKLAENAYGVALGFVDKNIESRAKTQDRLTIRKTRKEMRERLASSIYLQAQAYKNSQPQLAVQTLLRVGQVVPESEYRSTAEFDAANLLLEQKNWQQAVTVLLAFEQNYPNHKYSASIPAKLTQSYEALGQWQLAAAQLLVMAERADTPELKREAQYTAADYYDKSGNHQKALQAFRTYANSYPEPFNIAQEVRYKMSEFYRISQETDKQYFWFRKILNFHSKKNKVAPQQIGAREIELASTAAFGLATAHQTTFNQVRLKAPLQTSLKRKQKAMKQAIHYFQQVLTMELAQYVPQSTYQLAEMYRQLAADVMQSERPKNLDELALEEYEILLEELAYPFEEKAIEIHETNSQRAWQDIYDRWIAQSFNKLAEMSPALYDKKERSHDVIDTMY
ncbi:tetratricopeptide repeat protein [Shewanella gelidii]|uniref:Tetratricopeptide repeat protein n=1 Tax=Shewanella gelidii TaxID=1642821 RepID=A0A917JLQ3_9GAMM|nr:tetratricopeptide repeat protein [Shewanella gelidii]MCL1099204.1 tetratricopeptide repeat protein [Shewanella gelidii]GGI76392.1 hypothetical protein GCM10009332_12230 [Shewanella gelidii]